MALIECRQLTREYRRGENVIKPLDRLDLDVEAGGFLALMGPSGSGKTTLLNLIAGIDRPIQFEWQVYILGDATDRQRTVRYIAVALLFNRSALESDLWVLLRVEEIWGLQVAIALRVIGIDACRLDGYVDGRLGRIFLVQKN